MRDETRFFFIEDESERGAREPDGCNAAFWD